MFLISIAALQRNTAILREVADAANCRVALALKGYACWKTFPHFRDDLDGCCASGIWEAKLANEHFGKHIITYSPAYDEEEIDELLNFTHHLDFNSLSQWYRFRDRIFEHPRFISGEVKCGLRINPEHSTGDTPIYDPCAPGSRLGITAEQLNGADLTGLSGLHFHTLCEQNSPDLESTLVAVDEKFGHLLREPQFTYLNLGGGHWITKPFYNRKLLVELIRRVKSDYDVEVWLEPGEAVAIHSGVLRATVMDVFESAEQQHAILNISATAHMPDVIEMPYRPEVYLVEKEHNPASREPSVTLEDESYRIATDPTKIEGGKAYRLGGPTCLAGDVIGDYSFNRPLKSGDILVFDDMAHYTMVKTTTFNGVKHPPIAIQHLNGKLEIVREFGYSDFRDRLS
ncbi:MAG: carboxynorspermidine decarboxylase [Akkermansiaceae bacterium]